jgi:cytochrome oxidase assembly protein ShyY1
MNKHKSMKMMIIMLSTLKIAMELMTIQLKKKNKKKKIILTNY